MKKYLLEIREELNMGTQVGFKVFKELAEAKAEFQDQIKTYCENYDYDYEVVTADDEEGRDYRDEYGIYKGEWNFFTEEGTAFIDSLVFEDFGVILYEVEEEE